MKVALICNLLLLQLDIAKIFKWITELIYLSITDRLSQLFAPMMGTFITNKQKRAIMVKYIILIIFACINSQKRAYKLVLISI